MMPRIWTTFVSHFHQTHKFKVDLLRSNGGRRDVDSPMQRRHLLLRAIGTHNMHLRTNRHNYEIGKNHDEFVESPGRPRPGPRFPCWQAPPQNHSPVFHPPDWIEQSIIIKILITIMMMLIDSLHPADDAQWKKNRGWKIFRLTGSGEFNLVMALPWSVAFFFPPSQHIILY